MTAIEWVKNADGTQGKTWNPIVGCSVVSPGCTNCYAMRMAARLAVMGQERYADLTKPTKAGPVWTGQMRPVPSALTLPFKRSRPTTYFVNSMSDLFHEGVADAEIDRVFAVMALCPQHTFQVLTKRSARMRAYLQSGRATPVGMEALGITLNAHARDPRSMVGKGVTLVGDIAHLKVWPLPNVWLGVSAEDQRRANERVPDLLATPAAVRWVSAEPLLGPIDFEAMPFTDGDPRNKWSALSGQAILYAIGSGGRPDFTVRMGKPIKPRLDWIVVGGESGPGARPMHPDWARQIRDACAAAGVAFHFKQHGAYVTALDRERDDPDWRADYSGKLNDREPGIAWLNRDGGCGFHGERFHVMRRVGKAAAGRILDGVVHDAMPEVRRG